MNTKNIYSMIILNLIDMHYYNIITFIMGTEVVNSIVFFFFLNYCL